MGYLFHSFPMLHKKRAKFTALALCHNITVFTGILCTVDQDVVGCHDFGKDLSTGINPEVP